MSRAIDTLQQVLIIHTGYFYFVSNFDNISVLSVQEWYVFTFKKQFYKTHYRISGI